METKHSGNKISHPEGTKVYGRHDQGPRIVGEYPKWVGDKICQNADEAAAATKKKPGRPKVTEDGDSNIDSQ